MSEEVVVRVVASFDDQLGATKEFKQFEGGVNIGAQLKEVISDLTKATAILRKPFLGVTQAVREAVEIGRGMNELKRRIELLIKDFREQANLRPGEIKPERISDLQLVLREIQTLENTIEDIVGSAIKEAIQLFMTPRGTTRFPIQTVAPGDRETPRRIRDIHTIVRDTNNKIIKYVTGIRGRIPSEAFLFGVRKEQLIPSLEPLIKEVRNGFKGQIRRIQKGKKISQKGIRSVIAKTVPRIRELKKVSEKIETITKFGKEDNAEVKNKLDSLINIIKEMFEAVSTGDIQHGFRRLEEARELTETLGRMV
jgi:hypothetical protein